MMLNLLDLISQLPDRKIGIWGFGREGNSALRFIRHYAPDVMVTLYNEKGTPQSDDQNVTCVTSDDISEEKFLADHDLIIRSPGISFYNPAFVEARKDKTKIFTTPTNMFVAYYRTHYPNTKLVTISGTKGKSTTTALTAHLLDHSNLSFKYGGNIGIPLLDLIDFKDSDALDAVIIELSSYQIADLDQGGDIAVLLNLFPEHIQWHQTHDQYFKDKVSLVRKSDVQTILLNKNDQRLSDMTSDLTVQDINDQSICDDYGLSWPIKTPFLLGVHNNLNKLAALHICHALDAKIENAQDTFELFHGLPHRLQIVHKTANLTFINDSISTTPESALAAIECFAGDKIILIMGGQDRKQDFSRFLKEIKQKSNLLMVYILGEISEQLLELFSKEKVICRKVQTLEDAIKNLQDYAETQAVVVLSPAAPSYDQFKNFEHRGQEFEKLVKSHFTA